MADDTLETIQEALRDPEVPKIYANSFSSALGTGDVAILLKNGNKNVAVLNLSYTLAKTLSIKLEDLITYLESRSDRVIMTTEDVGEYLTDEGDHNDESTDQ